MFPIRRVDKQVAEAVEPLGSKSKFWFSDGNRRMLFKAEARGTGEDWAEKIACHLCERLGLPHVHYDLAELYDGGSYVQPGVVCETCAPPPLSLVHGNQLLFEHDPTYPADDRRKFKVRRHTPDAVVEVMRRLAPPAPEWTANIPPGITTALAVFLGYLMLDAWIANQDRHHENWGALRDDDLRLAPAFDHGACLARNITDVERKERMTTKDGNRTVAAFAGRATSAFYADTTAAKPLGTVQAFTAFARFDAPAARTWLARLASVEESDVQAIFAEVPNRRMTSVAKEFTLQLLAANRKRLQKETV